jgi:PAS domain S-box-containing protein
MTAALDAAKAGPTIAPPAARHRRSLRADALTLGLLYAALALLAITLARQPGSIAIVWFANGMAMVYLVTSPMRHWPALLAAMLAANAAANLAYGDSVVLVLGFMLANGTEVALAAWLSRRLALFAWPLNGPLDLLKLLAICAFIAPLAGATVGATSLSLQGLGQFGDVWTAWFVGTAVGCVITMPMALAWRHAGWRESLRQLFDWRVGALLGLTVGIALIALARLPYPFVYLVQAPIAAAFLIPLLAALTVCFVLGVTATMSMAFGVFEPVATLTGTNPVLLYLPALLSVLPAQMLIVGLARDRALTNVLAALSSGATDLMLMFDLQGKVLAVNTAWLQSIGRRAPEVVGRPWTEAIAPGVYSEAMQARVDRALTGETVRARVIVPFGRRDRRAMDVHYQPTFGIDGQRNGVIWTVHDVSDLIRTQDELERGMADLRAANEQLEQFARIAAHDLREPLNTIAQFSGLIEQDHGAALPPSARLYFDHLRQGAARMRTLLDDMLQLARLERPGAVEHVPVALDEVAAQVLQSLQARIAARGARLQIEPLPVVPGHAGMLGLLLQNLIGNAVKFVPPERVPEVRVSARREADAVLIEVADNGIGIDAAQQAAVFEPFKRLHSRRLFEGSGLGLTIAQRIVAMHGGTIRIDSIPGVGSRFTVRLPAGDRAAAPPA